MSSTPFPCWMRKLCVAAALATLCLAAAGCDDEAPPVVLPGEIPANVRAYHYAFDLGTREARSTAYLDVAAPGGDCVTLDAPTGVSELRWNDTAPAHVEPVDGSLRVCGEPLSEGQLALGSRFLVPEQTYEYTPVGFSRTQDSAGNPFSYLLGWVEQCDRFGPCNDAPASQAHFVFDVVHADGEHTLCPGRRTQVSVTRTRCELLETPAPTYSAFAIASNPGWRRSEWLDVDGTKLIFFETQGGRLATSLSKADIADFLRWIQGLLGPLPYGPELRIAGAPTQWLGMEHPANIILRDTLPELPNREYADMTRHVLMHEIVHQWAGNRITLERANDFSWKEGIAEYLTYVHELSKWPADAARTRAHWDRVARTALHYPGTSDTPVPFLVFAGETYGTGSMLFFVQLEDLLPGGQASIVRAIQDFLSGPPGARSVADLQAALERESGEDLDDYFDAWVHGTGEADWPTFQADAVRSDGALRLTVTQSALQPGKVYPVKVVIRLKGATQVLDVAVDFGLHPTTGTLTVPVVFSEEVTSIGFDPDNRVVSWNVSASQLPLEAPPQHWIF
ncbi:M1 family aminopeptidase [Pyxidicoccus xibeiensis]|uniref:M1 family aminopeptidase n=1 Tax=Pyxidicoccus xibeiensis TaxID=2906759 RepID=UPI0020A6EC6D|nr:M1 family aminopeptidase [Pyxidicoccus xibeiensis]MCP3136768.1 hypothetical protein [Pyxidicoccus xibeiensis]